MKKIIAFALIVAVLLSGCANRKNITTKTSKNINVTREYEPYGLFDEDSKKNPNIQYDLSKGNIALSIILCETIVVPVVLCGFYLYEPVSPKITSSIDNGVVVN